MLSISNSIIPDGISNFASSHTAFIAASSVSYLALCSLFFSSVVLDDNSFIEGLNDSKKLSEKKREKYYPIIMEKALEKKYNL